MDKPEFPESIVVKSVTFYQAIALDARNYNTVNRSVAKCNNLKIVMLPTYRLIAIYDENWTKQTDPVFVGMDNVRNVTFYQSAMEQSSLREIFKPCVGFKYEGEEAKETITPVAPVIVPDRGDNLEDPETVTIEGSIVNLKTLDIVQGKRMCEALNIDLHVRAGLPKIKAGLIAYSKEHTSN